MIVLDTNQLREASPPDGALLALLVKLAELRGDRLALPEIVEEEYLAWCEHEVQDALGLLSKTARKLSPFFGEDIAGKVPRLRAEDALTVRRQILQETFRILPTPEGSEHDALIREMKRQRPASTSWDNKDGGSGARDAVIWLTILNAARASSDEILFLSRDTDFGTAQGWHGELEQEVPDCKIRLLPKGIGQLIAEYADPAAEPENLTEILAHPVVINAVGSAYRGHGEYYQMLNQMTTGGESQSLITPSTPDMQPVRPAGRVHAISVEGETSVFARVRWAATQDYTVEPARQHTGSLGQSWTVGPADFRWDANVGFAVEHTLLISLGSDGLPISAEVIRSGVLEFVDYKAIGALPDL